MILFLDIDGVLISEKSKDKHTPFQPSVQAINNLIKAINAEIVITSARRIGKDIKSLQHKMDEYGVLGTVVGKTKDGPITNRRGNDIQAYICENGVKEYVAVDDVTPADLIPPLLSNRVLHVPFGFRTGLTQEMVNRFLSNKLI